ncbi:hypothetical protein [Deinococcus peraridilitoris]|uniref:Uncharacterized protein n=1 Tax=Deinococcus peraridilitoris (strain DSM 19664 / LMG 22246 / CIP 109416 / KR-200) TaxID=937777 RepID=L0A5G5_DEIPD|nr:hypothetical protein [Deinococcus peraridilitoris]AFZ68674.1 hypothetical protein Deipe_3231 [Deinococcus peraridilitoris DSM 19664]
MPGARRAGVIVLTLALVLLASQLRVIGVQGRMVLGWAWQDGQVAFTNSVTGRPVRIQFSLRRPFSEFRMITDPDTEGYYTGGEYRINDQLKHEYTRQLDYCSEVGMQLNIGAKEWTISQKCMTIRALWPLG